MIATTGVSQRSTAPSARKNAAWNTVATSSPMIVTGRRPRLSASRLASSTPMMPGTPAVTARNTATSELEKSCAWVRYRLVSCDDGALNTLVRNAARPRSRNRAPYARSNSSRTRPRCALAVDDPHVARASP